MTRCFHQRPQTEVAQLLTKPSHSHRIEIISVSRYIKPQKLYGIQKGSRILFWISRRELENTQSIPLFHAKRSQHLSPPRRRHFARSLRKTKTSSGTIPFFALDLTIHVLPGVSMHQVVRVMIVKSVPLTVMKRIPAFTTKTAHTGQVRSQQCQTQLLSSPFLI